MRGGVVAKSTWGPLGNGLLHHRLGIFSRLDHVVGADGHSSGQGLLQILPAQVMGAGPGAVHRVALVDESDMDVVGPYSVQEPVQEPLVRLLLGEVLTVMGADGPGL